MDKCFLVFYILLLIILNLAVVNEGFTAPFYLGQPTKCFSCERQLPPKMKYLGGKTKCFSCERDMAQRYGMEYSDLGQPTKCFSCEKQMGRLPFKK